MIPNIVGKARRTGTGIIIRGMAHATIRGDASMIIIGRHGKGTNASKRINMMARNTIAGNTFVSERRCSERISGSVAHITIPVRWHMIAGLPRDRAIGSDELSRISTPHISMTASAALCNVIVNNRHKF